MDMGCERPILDNKLESELFDYAKARSPGKQ